VAIVPLPGGGTEYRIETARTLGKLLPWALFVAVWNAALVVSIHARAPSSIPAILAAFDLVFIAATVDSVLGRTIVTVDARIVRVRREWLGNGWTTSYDAETIESIDGASKDDKGASNRVLLKFWDGRTTLIAGGLPDRERADSIAAKMMGSLGRLRP
jgi:hypothetical protein